MVSEVLVLGGGLAGASAALGLAQEGIPVRLLERETQPHDKICGEFLSIDAQRDLQRLGIEPSQMGAIPIDRVRLINGARQFEARLPFVALGLSRRCLDEALLEAAASAGARIERGVKINALGEREVETSAGPCPASKMLLATGKREVRGGKRNAPNEAGDYVGFKMHWRIPPAQRTDIASAIELVMIEGGYVGLQRISDEVMNMCLIVRRHMFDQAGGTWEVLLARLALQPHIANRIGDAVALFERPLAVSNLPYGYVHEAALASPRGIFRLGDQFALTAPLTGDGMAIAMRSARLAAACIRDGGDALAYHRTLRRNVAPQVRRAMHLQGMAQSPLARQIAMAMLGLHPTLLGKLAGMTRLAELEPSV